MEDNGQEYRYMLEQIAQGNDKAFVQLYDTFWPELLRHIITKVNDKQVAEDIIHDIFMSLWNKRDMILSIESIPAYLYSACRYKVLTHYRKMSIASEVSLDTEHHPLESREKSIEERLYFRYLLDMVEREIEDLPEKCKEVFKLSRFSYLTNKEIAQKLSISESTVENHINKAIRKLKDSSNHHAIFFTFFF